MIGIVGNSWILDNWNLMEFILLGVYLMVYIGGWEEFMEMLLSDLVCKIKEGKLKLLVGKIFRLDEIVEVYRFMEENKVVGKIVVFV